MLFPFRSRSGRLAIAALAAGVMLCASAAAAGTLKLLMFEQAGCPWCARWNNDIGPVYGKTAEGKKAPLTRLDIHDPLPAGLALARKPQFTPTFVLTEDGKELGRIEGYPGADFFWALIDQLLEKAEAAPKAANKA